MKILITDDTKIARKMVIKTLNEILDKKDFEIIEACNGKEAVESYQLYKPNLTFLDLTMPVMDGFEALEKIKEIDENATVIIISADIQKNSIEKARELGATSFIKKPIDAAKLNQIIEKI
ncbi:two-component system response regulator [Malaciobacter pacificus]|uniref:Signal transduction response regulator n=1 Tax=Malaciobacter pacificus TaxID=1080223 RepID=A0A5C2H5R4_9BACT|nr:response regulator [Malaciobacter pacificus]QEP34310.1 signal transduction response regulator [Malaciobacter pacificus]GGD47969.1 two-component system response regulator [Malaciobacter pacificus]